MSKYTCRTCGIDGEHNFYKTTKYQCKTCWNKRTAQSGKDQVKLLKEEFGGKCSKCGYDKCMDALQFHHVDPTKKEFALGQGRGFNIDRIREELKKCIMVCSNCHIEMHYNMKLN